MSSFAFITPGPGERYQRLPLNKTMHALLGSVIRAIDRRYHTLSGATADTSYDPETCEACGGAGYILVPALNAEGNEEGVEEDDPVADPSGDPTSGPVSTGVQTSPQDTAQGGTAPVGVQTSTGNPALAPTGALAPAPAPLLPAVAPAAVPAVVPAASSASTAAPVMAPAVVAGGSTLPAPAVVPVGAQVPAPNAVPAPSTPIAGYTPLGPEYPPPPPQQAVFANSGADRYYAVTRGLRVGVFGTWQTTSPYVTGVSASVYTRYPTIHSAYEAYQRAYADGAVSYI